MASHITFITGGQRSGKSSHAQQLAEEQSSEPIYLATSRIWDEDFRQRIERHQNDRGNQWTTIEEEKQLSKLRFEGQTVLLDCITLWLTNIYYDNNNDVEKSLQEAKTEWDAFIAQDFKLIVVSNELGMGVHPENEIARKFTDLQGCMNQYIAKKANEVVLMVSGIPVKIGPSLPVGISSPRKEKHFDDTRCKI
ncbi:MAG: bifunctional adenosylcobinamide kinase/adenosylcobinamide-phosphate guanylyltransferase [Prolixibacteraceae bacterium]|nr:bifunctional adenosylcobinamide kinase/adenosylcobinamide-phosphate guanylyltransferase [Prolixibacteraceae bacterium]MBN2649285.1 bifunctional adenosylcobinamide kinase/adenosylcobinamide-phosphate guanylyltransferase [Prolixibacteraceae bacterium]